MEGWIKLHRKILDNPVVCKDSETLSIWLYLLLNATHQEIPATFKGEKIILKKGQLITGIISISEKLVINKNKVQRTLKCFESDKQIEQQTSNKNRLITILNWDMYQSSDKQNDKQLINNWETTDKQNDNKQECNIQEYKECNNIYLFLFNKYKEQIFGKSFSEKIRLIRECENEEDYKKLDVDKQKELTMTLIANA